MTEREAGEIVRAVEHLWRFEMDSGARAIWIQSMQQMASTHASEAVLRLSERQRERPTLADVRHMIAKIVRDKRDYTLAVEQGASASELPLWVKRWACARYYASRFGKQPDFRRFREQGEWADQRTPLMPDNEWVEEAAQISTEDVLATVGTASGIRRG